MAFGQADTAALRRIEASARLLSSSRLAAVDPLFRTPAFPNRKFVGFLNGQPIFLSTTNVEAADTVGTDEVWPGGSLGTNLTGAGVPIAVWDSGSPQLDHPEFVGSPARIRVRDSAVLFAHSTGVVGTLVASGLLPNTRGGVYQGSVDCFNFTNDTTEMAANGANYSVSNHSYAYNCGWVANFKRDGKWGWLGDTKIDPRTDWKFGYYSDDSKLIDGVVTATRNLLPIFAASNARGGPATQPVEHWAYDPAKSSYVLTSGVRNLNGGANGFNSLPFGGQTAKNTLVVGSVAAIAGGYKSPADVRLMPYSGTGPTLDGRIKPDVVSPGNKIYTTSTGSGYQTMSGTSIAAPTATAAAALVSQAYRRRTDEWPWASDLRAILIHTADPATTTPGPNYQTGWGLINTKRAVELVMRSGPVYHGVLKNRASQTRRIESDGKSPIKVTIAWSDPASPSPAIPDRARRLLVNDLDIRLENFTTKEVSSPWILDQANPTAPATRGDNLIDNVEQIVLAAPKAGVYRLMISAKNPSLLPTGEQPYSLVVSGATLFPILETLSVNTSPITSGQTPPPVGTVSLSANATYDYTLTLASSAPELVVPATVKIAKGRRSATFTITSRPVAATKMVTLSASFSGKTVTSPVEVRVPVNNAKFISQSVPLTAKPGSSFWVELEFENTGTNSWSTATFYYLYSQSPAGNSTWGRDRTYASAGEVIARGARKKFGFFAKAPTLAGTYDFQWRMRQGSINQSFGEPSPKISITVAP